MGVFYSTPGAQSPYYRPDSDTYLKKDGKVIPLSVMQETPPAYNPAGRSDEEFYRQHAVLENLLRLAQCQANNENTAANALDLCPNVVRTKGNTVIYKSEAMAIARAAAKWARSNRVPFEVERRGGKLWHALIET